MENLFFQLSGKFFLLFNRKLPGETAKKLLNALEKLYRSAKPH